MILKETYLALNEDSAAIRERSQLFQIVFTCRSTVITTPVHFFVYTQIFQELFFPITVFLVYNIYISISLTTSIRLDCTGDDWTESDSIRRCCTASCLSWSPEFATVVRPSFNSTRLAACALHAAIVGPSITEISCRKQMSEAVQHMTEPTSVQRNWAHFTYFSLSSTTQNEQLEHKNQ